MCDCAMSWIRVFLFRRHETLKAGGCWHQAGRALDAARARARALSLSAGTRPDELFPQLAAVSPKKFSDWNYFAKRYCDAKKTRFGLDTKVAPLGVGCHGRERAVSIPR